ncbi:MAG TPA: Rnase Y domain-containing protein, partial [bacterium]|nr:Rnase Y domain-containing protein [bacterium]
MLAAALFVVGQSMGAAKARGEAESKLGEIKVDTEKIVAEARKEAETKAKEIIIEARDEAQQLVKNADKENRKKQSDFDKLQNRLNQKEESLDKKLEQIEKKEEDIKDREKKISASEQEIEKKLQEQREKLQQISGLSAEEARAHLLGILDKDLKKEYANAIKDYGDKLKIEAKRRSQQIISMAIQRCAVDHVAESTVSVVPLSSDDMKGRIIGREGRNIR